MITTGRDPFARRNIRKRLVHGTKCAWCGNRPYHKAFPRAGAWQYYVDADSARESGDIRGTFCSIGCLNSYHG